MKETPESRKQRNAALGAGDGSEGQRLRSENARLQEEVLALNRRVAELSFRLDQAQASLRSIKESRTWKINRWYMKRIHSGPIGRLVEGLADRLKAGHWERKGAAPGADPGLDDGDRSRFQALVAAMGRRRARGVFLVTAAFRFDDSTNQRVINLAREMARAGYNVIFGVWRWPGDEFLDDLTGEVRPGIFQVPMDVVAAHGSLLSPLQGQEAYFLIEFVHPAFVELANRLKEWGFVSAYDIIDDWEEFAKAGKAPWFDPEVERNLVTGSDVVTAVSPALASKFTSIRADIHVIGNGFSRDLLGAAHENVCAGGPGAKTGIDVGYFGHLEPAWFDWDAVFALARDNDDIRVHIIGYGESERERTRMGRFGNIVYHGKVHPARLHRYVRDWDVAMIPFRNSSLSLAVDPIKLYEYLYFGLPVVTRNIALAPSFAALPFVKAVAGGESLAGAVRELAARKRDKDFSYGQMKEVVSRCSWRRRFEDLLSVVRAVE